MGGKQLGSTDYELTTAKKYTKREKFLAVMEAVVPWQARSRPLQWWKFPEASAPATPGLS
jgi:hypothetical protein